MNMKEERVLKCAKRIMESEENLAVCLNESGVVDLVPVEFEANIDDDWKVIAYSFNFWGLNVDEIAAKIRFSDFGGLDVGDVINNIRM